MGGSLRIAHVITRMIVGGAQENTLYNCLDLIRNYGDEVRLYCGPTDGPEGRLLEQGRGEGLPVVQIDSLRRNLNPIHDWQAYRELLHHLREFQPEVVHTHSAKGGLLGRAAASAIKVPAIVHTVHGAPFHEYQPRMARWFFRACERWAAKRCHQLISVADAMTELLVANQVASKEKCVTIYSGMDVEPFLRANEQRDETRKRLGIKSDEVVVGKIARLFHLKGHEYVIEAARTVLQKCPQVRFLFVGDGILRRQWEETIDRYGLTSRFVFTGLVSPEDIPALIGGMDMLVHTSLREGLARALPQALLAGKPVISYDIDGAREVVIEGQTGFLLTPKSTDELSAAIIRLAQDADLRCLFGLQGRTRFEQQFRHEYMTERIRQIYLMLLQRS